MNPVLQSLQSALSVIIDWADWSFSLNHNTDGMPGIRLSLLIGRLSLIVY